jgi:hypothetical protein
MLRATIVRRCSSSSETLVLVTAAAHFVLMQSKRDAERVQQLPVFVLRLALLRLQHVDAVAAESAGQRVELLSEQFSPLSPMSRRISHGREASPLNQSFLARCFTNILIRSM